MLESLIPSSDINIIVDGYTPLQRCAQDARIGCMKMVLKAGGDPNIIGNNSICLPPLFICCFNNHYDMVKVLLKNNANPNLSLVDNSTPLFYAVRTCNFKIVKLLLENGADINHINERGNSPLMIAIKMRDAKGVAFLISKGASLTQRDTRGQTPLMIAIQHFFPVMSLLHSNENLISVDENGLSAMDLLNERRESRLSSFREEMEQEDRNYRIVSEFMKFCTFFDCHTKGEFFSFFNFKGGVKYFSEEGKDGRRANIQELLALAIIEKKIFIFKTLIEECNFAYDVNHCFDSNNTTLIHFATSNSDAIYTSLLITNGANASAKLADSQMTPLHMALYNGHLDVVKILIINGNASIDDIDSKNNTSLDWAKKGGHGDCVEYLENQITSIIWSDSF